MLRPVQVRRHHARRRSQDSLPLSSYMQVQAAMSASEVADQCLLESGARGLSAHAKDVAMVALMLLPNGAISLREYRRRIKEVYLSARPEHGSFFLLFVLPILISLISNWVIKWIVNRTDLRTIRSQAFDSIIASSPHMTVRLTSISSQIRMPTEP